MANEFLLDTPPKRQPTMYTYAFETLRDEILAGKIPAGERLNIEEIEERLGVSRTPVREALKQLSTMGLVENRPHHGTYIKKLSIEDMIQIYQIRAALEGVIARLATENLSKENLDQLESLCDRMENGSRDIGHAGFRELNNEFHAIIRDAVDAPILKDLAMTYYHQSAISRAISIELPGSFESVCNEHRNIADALVDQEPETADNAMKEHFLKTAERISESMGIHQEKGNK